MSRDRRFDGRFFVGVVTTRVYCRPSCPATPKPQNLRHFPTAAAAQGAGYRACKRCSPDAAPGWYQRGDLAGKALRLIADGVVDREGVSGLAARLGYSERQLHRCLVAELGAAPQALARAQRAQTARMLLESTSLRAGEVAFAAGFASIRQFNETIKRIYGKTPTELRGSGDSSGVLRIRLAYRPPLHVPSLYSGDFYRGSLCLPYGRGLVIARDGGDHLACELELDDVKDLTPAVSRVRALLDLDADPAEIDGVLGADPRLAPLVAARPGVRLLGPADPDAFTPTASLPVAPESWRPWRAYAVRHLRLASS